MKTKPHYVPVRWLTTRPLGPVELAALRAAEGIEGAIAQGIDWASNDAMDWHGLAQVDTKHGRVVFKPHEHPVWISTPTG